MSAPSLKLKPATANQLGTAEIDKQIRRGKAVLRELKATLQDLEDQTEIVAAKKRNGGCADLDARAGVHPEGHTLPALPHPGPTSPLDSMCASSNPRKRLGSTAQVQISARHQSWFPGSSPRASVAYSSVRPRRTSLSNLESP